MKRREFISLVGGAAAMSFVQPLPLRAQQTAKLQVGFLYPGPQPAAPPRAAAFASGILAGGVRADQFEIIPAVTGGDPALLAPRAADLVTRKVDLILAASGVAVRAARAATASIPIVAIDLESDPVASGFIATNARPGGNVTGVFLDFPEFAKKWLEVLTEATPQASSIAVFWDPAMGLKQFKTVETAAVALGIKLQVFEVKVVADLAPAFVSATQKGAGAVVLMTGPVIGGNIKMLAELALTHKLPAITVFTDFAREGGLMAYGPNLLMLFRQQGVMAAKILRGAKPADTPIETPTRFEFVLNLKTARLFGLTIPASILLRADEVIE
jgi:putative tryptophan/tyrosine transport system substrate-binding protein